MINPFGHRTAFLEERRPLKEGSEFAKEYDDYCNLYTQFYNLSGTFHQHNIPLTRLVQKQDGTMVEEYTIPQYCNLEFPGKTDDAIDANAFETNLKAEQAIVMQRWRTLMNVIEELSNHPYVHRRGGMTQAVASYTNAKGVRMNNVNITDNPAVAYHEKNTVTYEQDYRVTNDYQSMLMAVVHQGKSYK